MSLISFCPVISATFYEFGEQDFLWITHPMKQVPDIMSTTSSFVNMTCGIPSPENASNGDWFFNNRTKELSYIVSGRGGSGVSSRNVQLQVSIVMFYRSVRNLDLGRYWIVQGLELRCIIGRLVFMESIFFTFRFIAVSSRTALNQFHPLPLRSAP